MYNTYSLAVAAIHGLKQSGVKSIYFITADYTFGHQLEKDASDAARKLGMVVKGAVRAPLNTNDFSSFLLSAQASGAQALVLANAGDDTARALKQAAEFGITKKMKVAALLMMLTDVHAVGLKEAQGLTYVTGYYSGLNDRTRHFAKAFEEKFVRPQTMTKASSYTATLDYLKADRSEEQQYELKHHMRILKD